MRVITKVILILISLLSISAYVNATELTDGIQEQSSLLNINGFVTEAEKYSKDAFSDFSVKELLNDAIKGKVDNKGIMQRIGKLVGNEVTSTIRIIRKYCCYYCHT